MRQVGGRPQGSAHAAGGSRGGPRGTVQDYIRTRLLRAGDPALRSAATLRMTSSTTSEPNRKNSSCVAPCFHVSRSRYLRSSLLPRRVGDMLSCRLKTAIQLWGRSKPPEKAKEFCVVGRPRRGDAVATPYGEPAPPDASGTGSTEQTYSAFVKAVVPGQRQQGQGQRQRQRWQRLGQKNGHRQGQEQNGGLRKGQRQGQRQGQGQGQGQVLGARSGAEAGGRSPGRASGRWIR